MANAELIEAVQTGDIAAVTRLVAEHPESAVERDAQGVSAVLHACYLRRQDIVDVLLLRLGALDLLEAAAVGDSGQVERLLGKSQAEIDQRSGDGFTALHYAAFFGRPEIAGSLIAAGADVAAVASNTMAVQPLHSAAATSQRDVAERLLAAGADPNARQHGGFVPLHSAAQNGDEALAELLLGYGADPARETDDGRSAAAIARTAGHEQLAEQLEGRERPSS
jgi:ankyrin repeat protein